MGLDALELYYGATKVGVIKSPYVCDRTGYGLFELTLSPHGPLQRRIIDFIRFSEEWHERLEANPSNPPDAAEFDDYNDLVYGKSWSLRSSDGNTSQLPVSPVFVAGDITWAAPESQS